MATARPKLDRATIVGEALALLDAKGFDALSLRALATRLGVQAPALYWHFADRGALLVAMVEEMSAQVPVPRMPADSKTLYGWIISYGRAWRKTMLGVRDSTRLMAAATGNPALGGQFYDIVDQIGGMSRNEVAHVVAALNSLVLGWVHYEQQPEMREFMSGMMDIDTSFETGLRALARGLIAELGLQDDQLP